MISNLADESLPGNGQMSVVSQKRKSQPVGSMSDLPPKQTSLMSGAISDQCVDHFPINIARVADIRAVEAHEKAARLRRLLSE